jgi:hypothetical protein
VFTDGNDAARLERTASGELTVVELPHEIEELCQMRVLNQASAGELLGARSRNPREKDTTTAPALCAEPACCARLRLHDGIDCVALC